MNKVLLLVVTASVSGIANAIDLGKLDPRTRDEDISATTVTVDVTRTESGLWQYTYTYVASTLNKGTVSTFEVDISCPAAANRDGLPPQENSPGFAPSSSTDNLHAPVNLFAAYGSSSHYSISVNNHAGWLSGAKPGETISGLQLVSTLPPKPRQYTLLPFMDNDDRWDYESFDEDDPTVPWIPDFTVFGMTQGPSCPGDEAPPPVTRFAGTPKPEETDAINNLLTYSAPLSDRLHVGQETSELALTIFYADDMDPKTFRVEPQSDKLRKLFNPQKGTSETVHIPLEAGKNKFILSVQREFTPPGQQKTSTTPAQGKQSLEKDIDVFEVRVDSVSAPLDKKNAK